MFNEIKAKISQKYCRSILAIDNEINGNANERFLNLKQSCENKGILCHLYDFSSQNKNRQSISMLSKSSDVIVLDWLLSNDTPEESLNILKDLQNSPSYKFVLIDSKETPDSIISELKDEFNEQVSYSEEAIDEDEEGDEEGDEEISETLEENSEETIPLIKIGNNLFVGVKNKKGDVEDVLNMVYKVLETSYNDFLHWAGLELACISRELLPEIISKLPVNINGTLLFQTVFQQNNEVAQQVADILLDEISVKLKSSPLAAVSDDLLECELKNIFSAAPSDLACIFNKSLANGIDSIINKKEERKQLSIKENEALDSWNESLLFLENFTLESLRESVKNTGNGKRVKNLFSGQNIHDNISSLLNNENGHHISWANLRESVLLDINHDRRLQPGYIFNNNENEYFMCISPACDCYRPPNDNQYLFIVGSEDPEVEKSQKRHTQYCVKEMNIKWDASTIITKQNLFEDESFVFIGTLRAVFISRIIQRIWAYLSRVGVDTSEYIRLQRRE